MYGNKEASNMGTPKRQTYIYKFCRTSKFKYENEYEKFTRFTNGFSKKIENHSHAIALHFIYYNFIIIHNTLRVTPAMHAGIIRRLWNIEDLVKLI